MGRPASLYQIASLSMVSSLPGRTRDLQTIDNETTYLVACWTTRNQKKWPKIKEALDMKYSGY